MGDFNLIRCPDNRSRPGGNLGDMMLFNDMIHNLDLVDIAFEGRSFTWSNIQDIPLLQKLDWVFTSSSWTLQYPDTRVLPLGRPTSDHTSYVIKIGTKIPATNIFRFKNFWTEFTDFLNVVELHWTTTPILIMLLRLWQRNLSKLERV